MEKTAQYYKIANLTVRMNASGKTARQGEPYRCPPDKPAIVISSEIPAAQDTYAGLHPEDREYMATGASFYRQLLKFDGMLLHASAVVLDGSAYLFSASSGTGKSTHTRLWLQVFGDRAYILNDDKPALRLEDGIWYAYGTPWSGKEDISVNARVPVAGICFLHQAEENRIRPLCGTGSVRALLEQTMRPADPELRSRLMELLDSLLTKLPVWEMGCNMEQQAALMAYRTMSAAGKEIE